jgi:hypothetical protein
MKILKKALVVGGETIAFLSLALPVWAQWDPGTIQITTVPGLADFTIANFVTALIRLIIIIAFIIAFIFLLIGGIRWITAGGETKAVEGARNMVTGALVGLIIVLAAFAIIRLIEFFFGVTIISGPITLPTVQTGGGAGP